MCHWDYETLCSEFGYRECVAEPEDLGPTVLWTPDTESSTDVAVLASRCRCHMTAAASCKPVRMIAVNLSLFNIAKCRLFH